MLTYQFGAVKTLTSSTAETIRWEIGTVPSGSQVKAVSFILTGTAQDLDSIDTIKFYRGGTVFMSFANDLQVSALCDSLGKKTVASSAARWTIPLQNIYGYPFNFPFLAAPPNEAFSLEVVTDGTGQAGTITPIFHLDPTEPANAYPVFISQLLGPAGSLTNYEFNFTQTGAMLHGYILDETNITNVRFNYLGTDVTPALTPAGINEIQELWQGTTVTTNRAFYLKTPVPVVSGQTKLIVTSGGNVGQIVPLYSQPYGG
jgi:hypothetical protein